MRVVFLDKLRETYTSVGNVIQIENDSERINGRITSIWTLILADGNTRTFKQKEFTTQRVEI